MILHGNHKSAKKNLNVAALEKEIGKEVEHGWALPLTIALVRHINNAVVLTLGAAEKFSINEKGERYIKRCTTHD